MVKISLLVRLVPAPDEDWKECSESLLDRAKEAPQLDFDGIDFEITDDGCLRILDIEPRHVPSVLLRRNAAIPDIVKGANERWELIHDGKVKEQQVFDKAVQLLLEEWKARGREVEGEYPGG